MHGDRRVGTPPRRHAEARAETAFSSPEKTEDNPHVKIKEADTVNVPQFPNTVNLYTWKTNLTRAVVVAFWPGSTYLYLQGGG